MPSYIDQIYYVDTFKGKLPRDPEEIDTYIQRAQDVIDMLTKGKLITTFDNLIPFQEELVKKAVSSQVLYFVNAGGYENKFSGKQNVESAGIGNFNYTRGKDSANYSRDRDEGMVAPATLEFLSLAGLLYAGVDTLDGGFNEYRTY